MFTVLKVMLLCMVGALIVRSGPSGQEGSPKAMQQSVQGTVAKGLKLHDWLFMQPTTGPL
jgi:hypothetical protein